MRHLASMRDGLVWTLGTLLLVGCGTAAVRPPREPMASSATEAGVEIVATTRAWRGWPSDLTRTVTPIHVRLVNRGSVPLRIGHDIFGLGQAGGPQLTATLPEEVRGVTYEPPPAALPAAGFALGAEGYRGEADWVMPGQTLWSSADPVGRVSEQFALPTPDILRRALPEGVLPAGGDASGFLYFDRLPAHVESVQLTVRLIDAGNGEPVAQAIVPLALP